MTRRCVSVLGLAVLLITCDSKPRSQSRSIPPLQAPEVEYSGCWELSLPSPVCVLQSSRIRLWVKADPTLEAVEIQSGDRLLSYPGKQVSRGRQFRFSVPPQTSKLTVRLRRLRDGASSPAWSLALAPPGFPDWLTRVDQLNRLGKLGEAQELLARRLEVAPPNEQGLVLHTLAAMAHYQGHDTDAAEFLAKGIAVDHAVGMLSSEIRNATMLVAIYLDRGHFDKAQQILERIPDGISADSRYLAAYNRGLWADSVGNYGLALEQIRRAVDLTERVGTKGNRGTAEQVLARILQELGRSQESETLFTRLNAKRQFGDKCDLGSLLTNHAWSRLLAHEGGENLGDPTPDLQEAQAVFDQNHCRPAQRLNARLNLALAHQQAGRWPKARHVLTEAREPSLASQATLDQRLWWLDLEGRQAIAEKNPAGAINLYDQLSQVAQEALSLEGRFRAAVGRAHAQLALGQPAEAIRHFQEADRLIDEQTWYIPAYEGRDTFVAQRESEMRQYLQLLLDRGQKQDALALVRRDRSRLLRQLALRDQLAHLSPDGQLRWAGSLSKYWALRDQVDREAGQEGLLPGDQLKRALEDRALQLEQARRGLDRAMADLGDLGNGEKRDPTPPLPGEVILAFHPLPKGWVGFAAHGHDIEITTFDLPAAFGDTKALARCLIEPFQPALTGARRLRVLPYGPLRSVDFHALPLAGKPLLAWLPVVYGLDLPAHAPSAPAQTPVALLVADPEGNLSEAKKESKDVAETIRGWGQGWTLKEATTAGKVREELPSADLFQFAGHGEYSGFAGWDSALRLANGSRLTPTDLLALRRVPSWVVLATCEGGRSSEEAPGEGIGLAQAFLLAGSRAVVAATRPVLDATAHDFAVELYGRWKPGMDLQQQFQKAQLACSRRCRQLKPDDWASFRLFEP
jgi:tetratricopeptide (TPR) repeat protein